MRKTWIIAVAIVALASPAWAGYKQGKGNLTGAFYRCEEIDVPPLALACGADSLLGGAIQFSKQGNFHAHIFGAAPSTTYELVLLAPDGGAEVVLALLETDALGDGVVFVQQVFPRYTKGVGSVLARRDGLVQFINGFSMENANLCRCGGLPPSPPPDPGPQP